MYWAPWNTSSVFPDGSLNWMKASTLRSETSALSPSAYSTPALARRSRTACSAGASATSQPEASSRSLSPGTITRRAAKSSIRR
ncbi:Uncharacterised protein [Mycobacteroides abscessus subsp. abscessus]|nr:Uncharacterised protein [Mycobacteroides abscessus subsp. abscessus]